MKAVLSLHPMTKLWFPAILILFFSCDHHRSTCIEAPELSESHVKIQLTRLEDDLFHSTSPRDVLHFLNRHSVIKKEFFGSDQYPSDTILARELYKRISNPYTDSLYHETLAYFGSMDLLKEQFQSAFDYISYYYPSFNPPKIETLISGFASSEMYVSDSLIVIGLEFYLGPTAKYRPVGIPGYILKRYEQSYIVPACILLLSNKFLKQSPKDNTMLADMVYYGKKYYFAKHMMPCTPDSLLIWYDSDELQNVEKNKELLWYHFLEHQLLYETNYEIKQKYMDERPHVFEIGDKCPGRIGSWIGWDIVRQYMSKNSSVTLQQLMNNPNARNILTKSDYRGK